jgi:outer membrane protein with beta-barrel domain
MKWIAAGVLSLTLASLNAQPAFAQEHRWNIAAGYTALNDTTDHVTFPLGLSVGAAVSLGSWLAIAGEVDRQQKTQPTFGSDITLTSTGVVAGLRAQTRIGALTEFVQVLAGGVTSTGTLFGGTTTSHHSAVQPGLGVDFALRPRWAARGEIDARWLDSGNEVRYVAALVYRFD